MPLFIKLIEEGKRKGYIDEIISARAVMQYPNAFKILINQTDFFASENHGLRSEIAELFFMA